MVQDRKEPTLSSIKPERDEIASHQSRMNNRGQAAASSRPPASRPAPAKTSALGVFALLLALGASGAAGFSIWQLQESQKALTASNGRIAELEARLNLTNTESDQSVTKIHEKLDWADSEIRKLWGVAYDTNRKGIAANKSGLQNLSNTATAAVADAKKANETLASQQNLLATLRTQGSEQQLLVSRANEKIGLLEQQLRQVSDTVANAESKVSKLENNLNSRVATNEEAIKAIDSFRRTANSDIQRLKEQVGGG